MFRTKQTRLLPVERKSSLNINSEDNGLIFGAS